MEGNRLPVVVLYGQVEGTKSRGRQPKKWIDNVKQYVTAQGMNMREAVDNSRNRRIWRSLVEASSSANAWRRRNWMLYFTFSSIVHTFVCSIIYILIG